MKRRCVWHAIACGILLSACTPAPTTGPDQSKLEVVSGQVTLVGDTQEHEITGLPAYWKGGFLDRELTEVTIRPPQQALFGRMILADTIQRDRSRLLIHLGDLLDLSCRSELRRMDKVFDIAGQNWVLTPGNHDGLAMGIFNFSSDEKKLAYGARAWDYECRLPAADGKIDEQKKPQGYFISSDVFLSWYLTKKAVATDLPLNFDPTLPPFGEKPAGMDEKDPKWRCNAPVGKRVRWVADPKVKSGLLQVEARIEHWSRCHGTLATRSYLLQKIALPPAAQDAASKVSMILLDTTQTDQRFDGFGLGLFADTTVIGALSDNPGNVGYLMKDQLDALGHMIAAQGEDEILIFGGHHNWDSLSPDSRKRLVAALSEVKNPLVYISAHTHSGFWKEHDIGNGRHLLELNVSSLADWPVAFRTLQVRATPDRKLLQIDAPVNGIAGELRTPSGQPSRSARLIAEWSAHCKEFKFDFEQLRLEHSKIVDIHRQARQDWKMLIDSTIPDHIRGTTADSWDNYVDKLNDMERGAEALGLAADLNQEFRDQIAPVIGEIHKKSGLQTACDPLNLRQCAVDSWNKVKTDMERIEEAKDYYKKLAPFIAKAQAIIDATPSDQGRTYLACSAVAAALSDLSIEKNEKPENLTMDTSFYDDHALATW